MISRALVAALMLLTGSAMARAQTATVVATCGAASANAGKIGTVKPLTQDANGNACTAH